VRRASDPGASHSYIDITGFFRTSDGKVRNFIARWDEEGSVRAQRATAASSSYSEWSNSAFGADALTFDIAALVANIALIACKVIIAAAPPTSSIHTLNPLAVLVSSEEAHPLGTYRALKSGIATSIVSLVESHIQEE